MKLNLSKCEGFSMHRSGWSYAIRCLKPFHSNNGIFLDDFVERKFIWNRNKDSSYYDFPWIGILHIPRHNKPEFDKKNSLDFLFEQSNFQKSLKKCMCLIALSESLLLDIKELLNKLKVNIPTFSVKHPTEKTQICWSPDEFLKNKSITQLGYWLRNLEEFSNICNFLKINHIKYKTYCMPGFVEEYLKIWQRISCFAGKDYMIHEPTRLDNLEYDEHLSKTLVYVCMWATSANNGIIEPMIRNTPIITNKLPATTEYLGEDYPLYYEGPEDIVNIEKILQCHEYLKNMNKDFLHGDYFANDFITKLEKSI